VVILRRLSMLAVLFMLTRDQTRPSELPSRTRGHFVGVGLCVPFARLAGRGVGAKLRALAFEAAICSDDRLVLHPSILPNLGGDSECCRSKLRRGGDNGIAMAFDWGVPSRVGELSSCAVLAWEYWAYSIN